MLLQKKSGIFFYNKTKRAILEPLYYTKVFFRKKELPEILGKPHKIQCLTLLVYTTQ